jgi:hypothetical protein
MASQPNFTGEFRPQGLISNRPKPLPSLPNGCSVCANHSACWRRRPDVQEHTVNLLLGGRPLFCSEL